MKRSLRKLSFCARDLLLHRLNQIPNLTPSLFSLSASSRSIPRFFSSTSNSPDEAKFTQIQKEDAPSNAEDVISNEELKKRIAKLEEGDREAIPEIFEGILEKLLSGKPEEVHNELRKEILGKETESSEDDDTEDEESDFDEEDMIEADHEEEANGNRR